MVWREEWDGRMTDDKDERIAALEIRVAYLEAVARMVDSRDDPLVAQSYVSRASWIMKQYVESLIFSQAANFDPSLAPYQSLARDTVKRFADRLNNEVFVGEDRTDAV
jgi:hypothetical protein